MTHKQPGNTAAAPPAGDKSSRSFVTKCYRAAIDRLGTAFTECRPLAMLVGEDNEGADFVIGSVLDAIAGDVDVGRVTEPCPDAVAGMREIVRVFGLDSDNKEQADLEDVFRMFLSLQRMHGRRTIIRMEATQENKHWMLDEVRQLVELEMAGKFGLLVIVSGRLVLNELRNNPSLKAILENSGIRIALVPFTLADTEKYIRWRIESAGPALAGITVETGAIALIHKITAGIPDAASNLCSNCFRLVEEEGVTILTANIVNKATKPGGRTLTTKPPGANGVASKRGRLIVRMGGRVVGEQVLNQGQILIGRDRLCDIHLANAPVSRRHAKVVISSKGAVLSDLGSRNGTYVNGRQIKQHDLQNNDSIQIGECWLDYVAGDDGLD